MSKKWLNLMVVVGMSWPAVVQAQDAANPGPFYWGTEAGIQSFELPGIRQGVGNFLDSTGKHELDAILKFYFGKPTEEDVFTEFLGENQRLEFGWTHAAVDTRETDTAPSVFARFEGGTVTFAGAQTMLDDYEYTSNEFTLKLIGQKTQEQNSLETYMGIGYQRMTQEDTLSTTGSALVMYQHRMNSDNLSFFIGAEQTTPIQKGLSWVIGGEAGLVYMDSYLVTTQNPRGNVIGTATIRVSADDAQWMPRLRAQTGIVCDAPDGKSRFSILGRVEYLSEVPYINGLSFVGDSVKISNAEVLNAALVFDFTCWF